jgi:acetylglutamate kinase
MKSLTIIKIGGNIVDDEHALRQFLDRFAAFNGAKILVHGGGKLASRLGNQLGVVPRMEEGRRITCSETLKITTMVYAGLVNKTITALLNSRKIKALGLCGADLFLIPAEKRKAGKTDFGFVGDVVTADIDAGEIAALVDRGITLVVAPITSDMSGQLLNTNADTIASSLAVALASRYKVDLVYGFEKDGVMRNNEVIRKIDPESYLELKNGNVITDGMIPKLDNAFSALSAGVEKVTIGNALKIDQLVLSDEGTHITK